MASSFTHRQEILLSQNMFNDHRHTVSGLCIYLFVGFTKLIPVHCLNSPSVKILRIFPFGRIQNV